MLDKKIFIISILIACVIAYALSYFCEISFWLSLAGVIFAMVLNGFLAEWEDNRPGGFNNPKEEEIENEPKK